MAAPTNNRYIMRFLLLFMVLWYTVQTVDKNNFKTCQQSSFCRRNRKLQTGDTMYIAQLNTLQIDSSSISLKLLNTIDNKELLLELISIENNIARLKINEADPINPRYEVPDVLVDEPHLTKLKIEKQDYNSIEISLGDSGKSTLVLTANPFRVDFMENQELVLSVNSRGLLSFEHLQEKTPKLLTRAGNMLQSAVSSIVQTFLPARDETQVEEKNEEDEEHDEEENVDNDDNEEELLKKKEEEDKQLKNKPPIPREESDLWEEKFKTHHDSKPNGPESISLDFSFVGFDHVYGIPEHADTFALKTTTDTDPYRLYNLDVFEYELHNPMALYGSIPYMIAHNTKRSLGLFWLNSAETWIDISSNTAGKPSKWMEQVVLLLHQTSVHINPYLDDWLLHNSNKGLLAEQVRLTQDLLHQLGSLVNQPSPIPTQRNSWCSWAWSLTQRYFTWDSTKFPTPIDMQNNLAAKSRKMVTIIDPHIKMHDSYHIYKEAKNLGYFVKNKDGNDYEGWCWPGTSFWLDFTDLVIRDWWADKMDLSSYEGSTLSLFTWNDMNEPSVFTVIGKLMDYVKGEGDVPQTDTHWMSESGIIDVFVLLGPTNDDLFKQYASLTGTTQLPPMFSIAYHQCRWNYNDEEDVKSPLWIDFPDDVDTFSIEDEYLIGSSLLVHPVTDAATYSVNVYFPGQGQVWYDVDNHKVYTGKGLISISAPLNKIPVFQRGGSIIPRKERVRRSSTLMQDDPYTLVVAVNKDGSVSQCHIPLRKIGALSYEKKGMEVENLIIEHSVHACLTIPKISQ
ncbi:neutral alpha-glucosidase AB-like [Saccoglossus kowalevskii]